MQNPANFLSTKVHDPFRNRPRSDFHRKELVISEEDETQYCERLESLTFSENNPFEALHNQISIQTASKCFSTRLFLNTDGQRYFYANKAKIEVRHFCLKLYKTRCTPVKQDRKLPARKVQGTVISRMRSEGDTNFA